MLKFGLTQDFRNRARTWDWIPAKRAFFYAANERIPET